MMRPVRASIFISIAILLTVACKSDEKAAGGAEPAVPAAQEVPEAEPAPAAAEPEPAAAEPELPTDPKELELARKTAILEGRTADALKLCGAEDVSAMDEQAVLSCVLSACRENDREKAREWGGLLKGPLKKQARDVCKASNVAI